MENWSLDYCWSVLSPWKRHLALCGLCAMALSFIVTRFAMTRWYRAQTILRPASQEPASSTNLGAILGNITSGGTNTSLGNLFGTSASDANEFVAIISSVDFANQLVVKYNLEPVLLRHKRWWSHPTPRHPSTWMHYRMINARFAYLYDSNQGNLTFWFEDPDPQQAKRILDAYLELLRERLRARYVQTAKVAIEALEQQIAKTSDVLLAGQLDQLLAQQLEQVGTAELQASFAFVVIDPPVVPDGPYRPAPLIDSLVALILAPVAAAVWLLLCSSRPRIARQDSIAGPRGGQFVRRAAS
jgi:hypothetical protein